MAATKSNLDTLRTRITLFRAKEGRYPESLEELVEKTYFDAGVKRPYLKKIPQELVSSKKGSDEALTRSSENGPSGAGGWVYFPDTAEVKINVSEPLGKEWGEYAGEVPADW
ncbi:MAG: hypothetical protein NC819_04450 [Candidatus Omnitrophica bacterium]|nr:hypothetical protein [Candidatus Omnitrophota bacterium]